MLKNYKKLCTLFYDTDKPYPPSEELLFYIALCEQYKTDILEPMCGSGRFLIPLLQKGFIIDAFDASDSMVFSLKKKISKKNLTLSSFCHCLFEDYIFNKKYNLIFIPSASFGLFTCREKAFSVLRKIFDNLLPGGCFAFEVETPAIFRTGGSEFDIISNKILPVSGTGDLILGSFFNSSYKDNILEIICRYDFISNNQFLFSEQEKISVRLYYYDDILTLLSSVGFSEVKIYKNFTRELLSPFDALPEILVVECKKIKK
jgi:SAM-dependent methyltransferase